MVSDRNAKVIVKSIVKMYIEARQLALYGKIVDLGDWESKAITDGMWKKLLEAKAEQDREMFDDVIDRYTTVEAYKQEEIKLQIPSAFYGQLVNWFNSLQF